MTTYIVRRILQAIVVLIIVTLIVFFVIRLLPGDPLLVYIGQQASMQAMPEEKIEQLRVQFGLDKNIAVQYLNWMGNLVQGDFGESIFYHEKVSKLLAERLPVTLYIGAISLVFGALTGILVGLWAGVKRGKWPDKIITPITYISITVPTFWLAILMIYAFGLKLGWLPMTGFTSPFEDFWLSCRQLVIPVVCMSLFSIAANARQMRSSMLETISQDFIRTAWAKGLTEKRIILKHALKNSLIPVITLIGMGVGIIFGGSVLIEQVCAINGVGRLMVSSIFGQDYVVVQAITFVISVSVLAANLLVDISYGWFDPRIRYG